MQYINLGNSALRVSRICLGMMTYGDNSWSKWVLPEDQAIPIIKRSLDLGINFFDTADVYSNGLSEEITGRVLKKLTKRNEVIIASKVFFPLKDHTDCKGLSSKHISHSIDDSLKRLGTDYIDLYQIHRWDYDTPIEETLQTLNDLVKSGKIRYIGASSMYAWQFAKLQCTAKCNNWQSFISMQDHYNLVFREEEREMIPFCIDSNISILPWAPLAKGFLSGTRCSIGETNTLRSQVDQHAKKMYFQENDFEILERVVQLANQRGVKPAQIALAWLIRQPGVASPIVGATRVQYVDEAVCAVDILLTEEECRFLEAAYEPHEIRTLSMEHPLKRRKVKN